MTFFGKCFAFLCLLVCALPASADTWFVRKDGGTRFSANVSGGQCDGKADAAYPGHGVNQHCAFRDARYLWMDGTYRNYAWIGTGGDTYVIRSCAAGPKQQNPDAPHCRIGWDTAAGTPASGNIWCQGSDFCEMPPPPNGTPAHHTRLLGGCAFDGNCKPVVGWPYTGGNLTQLFAGFRASTALSLWNAHDIEYQGLEITTHNGKCARYGTTNPLPTCIRGLGDSPAGLSDQSDQGMVTSNQTRNILLQDVYIHGFSSNGITGAIGGPFTLKRVNISFNTFAGWNLDDGHATPDGPGASITQSYLTMVGNGCQEEYPITHPQFPAAGCWDSSSGGFGDAWSGQESAMDSFTCDHCLIAYNTKDGAIGPHTQITSIALTNSMWTGNMGQAGKWGQRGNSKFLFENNILVGDCMRMATQLPGAARSFDHGVHQPGAGLTGYCRAAGSLFAFFTGSNAKVQFNNNTVISYQPTIFQLSCIVGNTCGSSPYVFNNNIVLGYASAYRASPFDLGAAPGLFYTDDKSVSVVTSHNLWRGLKDDQGSCGKNGNICADPQLVSQPATKQLARETLLDGFNFHPSETSPANGRGKPIVGLATDFYGHPRPNPPSIGAVEAH